MQWKLPFKEYFESERSKLIRISSEYTPNLDELVIPANDGNQSNVLSEKQFKVINRFPSPMDPMDQNWKKMEQLMTHWKNQKEIWPLAYNMKIISTVNGISSLYVTHLFRRAFKLADGRTALFNSYVPSLALPLLFGSILHYRFITLPITSGIEKCKLCQCMTAGLIQSLTSTLYPFIYGSISSIYFADYFSTYPTPDSINDKISRKYLYDIWLKSVKRYKIPLISVSILNFLFGYYLTQKEDQCIQFMYISLLKQEFYKK